MFSTFIETPKTKDWKELEIFNPYIKLKGTSIESSTSMTLGVQALHFEAAMWVPRWWVFLTVVEKEIPGLHEVGPYQFWMEFFYPY